MSIYVNSDTRLVVQGITGRDGAFHAEQMLAYGTNLVAGVTPGKGGLTAVGVPVFNTVAEAVEKEGVNTACIFVPPAMASDAIEEALEAGVQTLVAVTEGIPVNDMNRIMPLVRERGARLIGPNCPGLISPGQAKVGILPGNIVTEGPVGLVSRSGTLTYEVVWQLTQSGLGQSTCIGIGGDSVIGTNFIDCLEAFQADPATEAIVMIGEIGGNDEEEAADYIKANVNKPVVGFIAGQTAPPGKRMGHAGAIISGGSGTAADKIAKLGSVGIPVAKIPSQIVPLLQEIYKTS
jgi:succinyl-CoA synthetase alpha subunit